MRKIKDDPRISSAHISLFVSLWKLWVERGHPNPMSFFCQDAKCLSKISSNTTFHKRIRELHAYGYIEYIPSFNHFEGNQVNFVEG
jgi:hypothetical protein